MEAKTLEAVRKSRLHWYSNWAKLVALQNSDRQLGGGMFSQGLWWIGTYESADDDVISVFYDCSSCALCDIFNPICTNCPLSSCGVTSLWQIFVDSTRYKRYPGMIRAAWSLYSKLEEIYQDELAAIKAGE